MFDGGDQAIVREMQRKAWKKRSKLRAIWLAGYLCKRLKVF